ncbi:MAG: thioredoxin family protein [Actinomycetota bacterium]
MSEIDGSKIGRRSFLALGIGALAWACGRGGGDNDEAEPLGPDAPDPDKAISIVATSVIVARGDSRQAFAVFRGQRPIVPDGVKAKLVTPDENEFSVEIDRERISRGIGGRSEPTDVTDIFVIRHDFDASGIWGVDVSFDGGRGSAQFQVLDESPSPIVGQKALATDSPTGQNPRGVEPICTRDPVCSMHEVTVAEAVQSGKPSVLVFATPQFCTSRTCGPIVDIVEEQAERVGDDVAFVHVEVWRDDQESVNKPPDGWAPAFAEWKLQTEPWVVFVDADGTIKDRWLGALGPSELRRAVDALR